MEAAGIAWRDVDWRTPACAGEQLLLQGWSPDGRHAVVSRGVYPDDHLAILDTTDFYIISEPPEASSVALGTTVVGVALKSGELQVLDRATGAVRARTQLPHKLGPSKALWSADDGCLAVVTMRGTTPQAYLWEPPAEPRVLGGCPTGLGFSMGFVARELRVVGPAALFAANLMVWRSAQPEVAQDLLKRLAPGPPHRWELTRDARTLFVTGKIAGAATLLVVDLATLEAQPLPLASVSNTERATLWAHNVSASADGALVAVTIGPSNGRGAVMLLDRLSGGCVAMHRQQPDEWLEASRVSLSPDGRRLLWMFDRGERWRIADLPG